MSSFRVTVQKILMQFILECEKKNQVFSINHNVFSRSCLQLLSEIRAWLRISGSKVVPQCGKEYFIKSLEISILLSNVTIKDRLLSESEKNLVLVILRKSLKNSV